MSDNDTSGNRWENDPDETPTDEIAATPGPDASTTQLQPSTERWSAAMRRPRAIAGAAAVAIALTGISGFAAGRATAGDTVVPVSAGTGQADGDGPADGQQRPRGPRGSAPDGADAGAQQHDMTTVTTPPPIAPRHVAPAPGRRALVDARVRAAAATSLWAALLLVTYWWITPGGVQQLGGGWATGLTSIGRLSGLVASVLLLAQVVLMARIPVLERAFGQDRLAHLHRLVGFASFTLMMLHVVTITIGYAGGSLASVPRTAWDLTVTYPGMLLAVAGTAALCMVVVTSVRAARRRLRYESWHLMHLYAYLGVGFALPHQLWTGQELVSSPARTAFWWTAWAATAAAVLVYRVGIPLWTNVRHDLRVTSVVREADGTSSVYVTGRRLHRLQVEAGQFFTWRFLAGSWRDSTGWTRAHPYSLSAAPDGRSLRITVQDVGDGSHAALALRPGTRAFVEGPYGRLSARARSRRKIALIGAGVGVTPLRALAEGLPYAPGDAVLLQRFTDAPLFAREFTALSHERGLQVVHLPGRRRTPTSWLGDGMATAADTAILCDWVPDIAERDVFICGPDGWTDLVRASLIVAGTPAANIHIESFAW